MLKPYIHILQLTSNEMYKICRQYGCCVSPVALVSLELRSQFFTNVHGLKMWSAVLRVQFVYTWDSMIHNTMFWMNHVQDSTLFNESFRSLIMYSLYFVVLACAPLSGTQVSLSFFDTGITCYITQSPPPLNLLGRGTMGVRWHKIVTFNFLVSIVPKSIVKIMAFPCPLAPPLCPLKVYPNSSRGVGWHDPIIY